MQKVFFFTSTETFPHSNTLSFDRETFPGGRNNLIGSIKTK